MPTYNFWARAQQNPAYVAVVEGDGREVSAGELLAGANQLVHGLRALGLERGDALAAVLPNSIVSYELVLAIQQAGFYLVPINSHLVGPEIAYIVRDCEAKALIVHATFGLAGAAAVEEINFPRTAAFAVGGDIGGFRPYAELKAGQPTAMPDNRSQGMIMNYTSGTTGRPKGVRKPLPEQPIDEADLGAALQDGYSVDLSAADNVHLLACPWYHAGPLVWCSLPSLHLGHQLVIMERFGPERCLQLIERFKVTITHMIPTQFVRLLTLGKDARDRYDVSSLRAVIHGAAPCSVDIKRQMIDWWGPVIHEYYASTEGVGGTYINSVEWLRKPASVGKTNGRIVIMDDHGNMLPTGQVGSIYSQLKPERGFSYFKDPDKTARTRRGEYATVGDLGYLDEDGYLFLCGRKSDMIISGGVNIHPAEIESVLVAHPKVTDAAVFGIPNEEWGEEVKAVIQATPGVVSGDALRSELMEYLNGRVARYKWPRSIDFMDELPRDPSGKLYKRKLSEPYWAKRE
jgi:long-chain acyl-CoA synthetase